MAKSKLNREQKTRGSKLPVVYTPEGKKYYFGGKLPEDKNGEQVLPIVYDDDGKPRYYFTALGQ